jgi:N6-adenosine-specific RNA methylase IME4
MTFGAILVDPPWQWTPWSAKGRGNRAAESKYPTMTLGELKDVPVCEFAAQDAALFMWVVDSHLDQGLDLMRVWGFHFKTIAFVWSKGSGIGLGKWTRKQCEICLLGTIGKPKRHSGGVRQLIEAPRREHSRKPDQIYERIERLVGGPYLEMFARQRWPRWDQWGDQVDEFEIGGSQK